MGRTSLEPVIKDAAGVRPLACLSLSLGQTNDLIGTLPCLQEQVRVMTEKHHVYLTQDGRISMAGLSSSKCRYLAEAINDAVRTA